MADWLGMRTEYITTDASYRDLAAKYGLNYRTVADRGKAEGWVELRNQYIAKTQSAITEKASQSDVARATKFHSVADKLLGKIEGIVDTMDDLDAKSIRTLSAALLDLKEVKDVMSDLDRREKLANIAKIEREIEKANEKDGGNITVRLVGGLEDYAK